MGRTDSAIWLTSYSCRIRRESLNDLRETALALEALRISFKAFSSGMSVSETIDMMPRGCLGAETVELKYLD